MKKLVKPKSNNTAARVVAFVAVFCLIAALAVVRNGSLFGKDARSLISSASTETEETTDTVSAIRYIGSSEIINTTDLGKDISGYAGPVPVDIYATVGFIDSVVELSNS